MWGCGLRDTLAMWLDRKVRTRKVRIKIERPPYERVYGKILTLDLRIVCDALFGDSQ